ncbi:MAG: enoyl-CoA hydratase/isomerase family protein [Chloroflexi bacterium]|nr:enoyl-CoA hydratase/isomerase family protein [Chloroflexota bacterium]MBV9598886.1 enoyl-CoA hydratase/isomerase family protein [Chloroflexota bacterium]
MRVEANGQAPAVLFERQDAVAVVTLNRPEFGNAVNGQLRDELNAAWQSVQSDPSIRVAVMTGAGERHFSTGADMKWQAELSRDETTVRETGGNVGTTIQWPDIPKGMWKPVILAVNGVCAGGGWHWMDQCDFAICSEQATFLEPHVSVGWVPVREMMGLAARSIPFGVVMRMALMGTSERMDAQRAYELGIVTEVAPQDRLMSRALEIAQIIAAQAPLAVQGIKEAMHRTYDMEWAHADAIAYADLLRNTIHRGPDSMEGPRAFAERRKPRWTGSWDPAPRARQD